VSEEELKPCPFCGDVVVIEPIMGGGLWWVCHRGVRSCRVKMEIVTMHEEVAVKQWNTRRAESDEQGA
jgi:hypothetical protein